MKTLFVLPVLLACLCLAGPSALAQEQRPMQGSWVKQRAATPRYDFYVFVYTHGENRHAADAIRIVTRRNREVFQEIRGIGGLDIGIAAEDLLIVVDANFDGRADLSLAYSDGGSGPNSTDQFFLAERKTGRFELDADLSSLTQVTLNADRSITSSAKGGCCLYSTATYRYVSGKLTRVASREERVSGDGQLIVTREGAMADGKMRYESKKRPAPAEMRERPPAPSGHVDEVH